MKSISALVALLVLTMLPARAEKPFPTEIPANLDPVRIPVDELPAGLVARMQSEEFETDSGERPDSYRVVRVDLTGDGEPETFVCEPKHFTGGEILHIFSSAESGFEPIGVVQGFVYLAKPVNGYAQIVATARAGGGINTRMLFQFVDGKYRVVRAADYRESGDREIFDREVDPATFR